VAEDGFAVAVYRDSGRWDCALLPPAVLADLDSCVAALRQQPPDGGPVALVDVADEFFVALRLSPSGRVRVLLSDVTAAEEWDLARQALDLVEPEPMEPPEPVDPEEVWPVGDLAIFRDLGLDERELGTILGDVDLWADEMLAAVAARIGVGEPFERVLASLQGSAATD
jgi:putative tRNA adenosine deaminase-associated protein